MALSAGCAESESAIVTDESPSASAEASASGEENITEEPDVTTPVPAQTTSVPVESEAPAETEETQLVSVESEENDVESADTVEAPVSSQQTSVTSAPEDKPQTTPATTPSTTPSTTTTPSTKPSTTTPVSVTQPEPEPEPAPITPMTAPADASPEVQELIQQYNDKQAKLAEFTAKIEKQMTLPSIHITTYNNQRILSKEEYVESVIDVFNCGEEYQLTAQGGVRVRGNSTASGSEKPYRIKFDKKQNMLGLHDGMKFKSWVLLRSQWNVISDYMGFSLAETIFDGKYYSSDCTFVNVYINERYMGLYLLCEQNQATEGRVEVYEPKKDEIHTNIGYFLEMDNYANADEDPFFTLDYEGKEFTDIEGKTQVFSADDFSIKSEINCEQQKDFAAKYLAGVFKIMYEAVENQAVMMFDSDYNVVSAEGVYDTPKQAVEAVMDLDSVVNTMILQELVHNYDVGAGSFYMAVDFSEQSKYERLTFLAPWDFNWAYSEETHGRYYAGAFQKPVHDMYDRSNAWLTVIMQADWFREMLKDKWAELGNGDALKDTILNVRNTAQGLRNDIGAETWRIDSAMDIVAFVKGRISWLNTQWSR